MTNELIFTTKFGSHVYGTSLPSSDLDYKGIFIPSGHDILLGTAKETISQSTNDTDIKNTGQDIDSEYFSLKKYMKLLLDGQTVALTMLFLPKKCHIVHDPQWDKILEHKDQWLHKGVTAFAGYCRQQANKYGIKGSRVAAARLAVEFFSEYEPRQKLKDIWPDIVEVFHDQEHCSLETGFLRGNADYHCRMLEVCNRKVQEHVTVKEALKVYSHVFNEYGKRAREAETNTNVDWKACMHAVRVAKEAQELLKYHTITYPRPEAQLLLDIRQGLLDYTTVAKLIEDGLEDLENAQKISTLPEKPNRELANELIKEIYYNQIIKDT